MVVPDLAHTSCGIKELERVGLVDWNGTLLPSWSRINVDLSSFSPDEEACNRLNSNKEDMMSKIKAYIGELLKSVQMVSDVMEGLVKRVTVEESEIVVRKDKVTLSQEKIRRKAIQIERMSSKFEEMMQQRVEESFSKASEGSQKNKNIRTEQGGDRDDSFPARKTQLSYRFEH
ncbi:uncharacterized protein LOC7454351 [Populus trichocarpa]|jgi:hypothetical protein|uniref:Uncharacterized protein n=1 Tax=Populus trichocarpa TaxID=3694 RepID=B9H8N6_POPTR|nr:uncharacterized protein LOC7454351 [Populus trichocarpa]|eukprot:XP_002307651.1 uncharacterized protein LOC7454351 [Populus trichocarpa]